MSANQNLLNLVQEYKRVKELRLELDKQSKALKEGAEATLQQQILQLMMEEGVQSVNFSGVGRVVRTTKPHYEITDKSTFARAVLDSLIVAAREQRPLSEAMLAQFRVNKESLQAYIEATGVALDGCGLVLIEKPELSIRK